MAFKEFQFYIQVMDIDRRRILNKSTQFTIELRQIHKFDFD